VRGDEPQDDDSIPAFIARIRAASVERGAAQAAREAVGALNLPSWWKTEAATLEPPPKAKA
jgi:hypothetical protein